MSKANSTAAFAVLMSVWANDDPIYFRSALKSATLLQELKPAQLILVVDGPIGGELQTVVDEVQKGEFGPAKVHFLPQNSGLWVALEAGLALSDYDLIARADADDINLPHRFQIQIPFFISQNLALLGGQMRELQSSDSSFNASGRIRKRPLSQQEITAYLANHSPFHHPTIVYSKAAIKAAGGYRDFPLMEDYDLWNRLISNGAKCANVEQVVVEYRVNEQLFNRRGGLKLFRSDLRMQRELLRHHHTTMPRAFRNIFGRALYRFAPNALRAWLYDTVIEKRLAKR